MAPHLCLGARHHATAIERLAESLEPLRPDSGPGDPAGAPDAAAVTDDPAALAQLLDAHTTFVRELLLGRSPDPGGWGLADTRLSAREGAYLKRLFPRATFLVLVRDPRTGYLSYRGRARRPDGWPRSQVRVPLAYGRTWRDRVTGFLDLAPTLEATVLRYEDLVTEPGTLDRLEGIVGGPLRRGDHRPPAADAPRERGTALTVELSVLGRVTAETGGRLGYGG